MCTANNTATCWYPLLFNFMVTSSIWLGTAHPCNPPQYGLWVNLHFFTICMYEHCFLPVLPAFVMECCIKIPCSLPHNHFCCLLPSPVCLPHLLICTRLNSSPIACPPSSVLCWCRHPFLAYLHLCYVDGCCVFFLFFFLSVLKFHSFVLFLFPRLLCVFFLLCFLSCIFLLCFCRDWFLCFWVHDTFKVLQLFLFTLTTTFTAIFDYKSKFYIHITINAPIKQWRDSQPQHLQKQKQKAFQNHAQAALDISAID